MTEETMSANFENVDKPIQEITLAFLVIIKAIKNQPGFDKDQFKKDIKLALSNENIKNLPIMETVLEGSIIEPKKKISKNEVKSKNSKN
ncbi:MAG: hypothetical protein U0P46_08660 [Holophagaceae bacterium]